MISGQIINLKADTFGAHSYVKACAERIPKAIQNGIYKESYRVAKVAKEGLKAGAPGGKALAPQAAWTKLKVRTKAARKAGTMKTSGNRSILSRFGPAIRYKVRKAGAKTSAEIGFVDGKLDRWAEKHATGYRIRQTPARARMMARVLRAAGIPKAPLKGLILKVPPRPIIGPVWEAEKNTIYNNIRDRVMGAAKIGGRY